MKVGGVGKKPKAIPYEKLPMYTFYEKTAEEAAKEHTAHSTVGGHVRASRACCTAVCRSPSLDCRKTSEKSP